MKHNITEKVKQITGTRKRSFSLDTTDCPQNTNSYWSGGTRYEYMVYNLDTRATIHPNGGTYPWTTPNLYTLQPGDVLIRTGFFCGKEAAPRFLCLPQDEQRAKAWLGISNQ